MVDNNRRKNPIKHYIMVDHGYNGFYIPILDSRPNKLILNLIMVFSMAYNNHIMVIMVDNDT